LVYLPHSSVIFSRAVNKAINGSYCMGMVVDTSTTGAGSIFANDNGGLTLPEVAFEGHWSLMPMRHG
jgi:hypothetical protein